MATKAQRLVPKLLRAIHAHDLDATRAVLDEGADPNGVGGFNARALQTAVSIPMDRGVREAIVALLLDRGADPNDRGGYGCDDRPVFFAAYCGHAGVVRMLLDRGGFPRDAHGQPARNADGATLLFAAARSGVAWLVERALAEGTPADDVDRHGSGPLHDAAIALEREDGTPKDTAATLTRLLDAGADITRSRPGDSGTAMHWAAGQGDAAAVRLLHARGADLFARTERGAWHPLHVGARGGREEAVRAVLSLGAEVDARDAEGATPLHHAARRVLHEQTSILGVAQALLDAGADPRATDASGATPADLARTLLATMHRRAPAITPAQKALADLLARAAR